MSSDTKYQCNQTNHEVSSKKSSMIQHFINKQEVVKFPRGQCDYMAPREDSPKIHIQSIHNGVNIIWTSVTRRQQHRVALRYKSSLYMKVSIILVTSVTIRPQDGII